MGSRCQFVEWMHKPGGSELNELLPRAGAGLHAGLDPSMQQLPGADKPTSQPTCTAPGFAPESGLDVPSATTFPAAGASCSSLRAARKGCASCARCVDLRASASICGHLLRQACRCMRKLCTYRKRGWAMHSQIKVRPVLAVDGA